MDVSDIFNFFFCSGRGKGESELGGGLGDRFVIEIPGRGGGGFPGKGAGPRGREDVWGPARIISSRTKRGVHKRGIHEKVKFPQFFRPFYTAISKRIFQKSP